MTIEQLEAANKNRERYKEVKDFLKTIENNEVLEIQIDLNGSPSQFLNYQDQKYLDASVKVIKKLAKKELKLLDTEFDEI